jgi:hypothetical protein
MVPRSNANTGQAMAPELIFLRVCIGRGWTGDTQRQINETSSIRFAPNLNAGSGTVIGGSGGEVKMLTFKRSTGSGSGMHEV